MKTYQVKASAIIDAPPARVYHIISDYHEGHPAILPVRYFTGMRVEQGGQGAGTVAAVDMNVFGAKSHFKMTVSEPEPGRVLREEDADAGVVTTFTIDPVNGGDRSRVTIITTTRTSPGLKGWLERVMNPAITRRIYREELAQLAIIAKSTN